ncbi:type II toxin-antitoxin system Phd/YefM family antitoxin [Flexivirga lutea]
MKTMSYTESRSKYAEVLDSVVDDREEVVITRARYEPAVIVSLDDYESLKETRRTCCAAQLTRGACSRRKRASAAGATEAWLSGLLVR